MCSLKAERKISDSIIHLHASWICEVKGIKDILIVIDELSPTAVASSGRLVYAGWGVSAGVANRNTNFRFARNGRSKRVGRVSILALFSGSP